MIADIEFRWVRRQVPLNHDMQINAVFSIQKEILQFRKQFCPNMDELNRVYEWTDWQDVPVVEE